MTFTYEITLGVLTAVVAAVTHLASNTGLPTKWCPWLALVLGVVGAIGLTAFTFDATTVISGLIVGLSAYGLWNGALDATGKQV